VTITFNEPARMTSIVVVEAGKPERKLEFMPGGSATVFMVHNPNLATGRNEIKWKALSKDGHPISGTIVIVIKPGAAPSSPKPAPSHDHPGAMLEIALPSRSSCSIQCVRCRRRQRVGDAGWRAGEWSRRAPLVIRVGAVIAIIGALANGDPATRLGGCSTKQPVGNPQVAHGHRRNAPRPAARSRCRIRHGWMGIVGARGRRFFADSVVRGERPCRFD
jgi:hypothetical protein